MNLKLLVPWICAVALAAAAGSLFVNGQRQSAELTRLRASAAETEQVRAELAQANEARTQLQQEVERARKDNAELLRLRGELGRLHQERDQLTKQAQAAQQQAQAAQKSVATTAEQQAAQAQQLQQLLAENQQLRAQGAPPDPAAAAIACLNNLRLLDGAKRQWALENRQLPTAVPTVEQLKKYLPGMAWPVCPGGGAYTINPVASPPACSLPGHALPR
jgi:chromosome segregation ATPase